MRYTDIVSDTQPIAEAPASSDMRSQRFYHGTSNISAAKQIMRHGINPGEVAQRRSYLSPMAGKVYLTQTLSYAIIYALGGDIAGHDLPANFRKKTDRYGYVFVVDGNTLADVQPDEDSVGQFFYDHGVQEYVPIPGSRFKKAVYGFKGGNSPTADIDSHFFWHPNNDPVFQIWAYIWNALTTTQRKRILFGEYIYFASGGKRALKGMPDWMKLKLIELGAHVAHGGAVKPIEAWRIAKRSAKRLARDGSNFFELATKLK